MPTIWGQHNKSQVFIQIGIVDALAMLNQPQIGGNFPNPQLFRALIDTGAQRTMISPNVVSAVGLSPIGKIKLQGIGNSVTYHNGYLFHCAFVVPTGVHSPGPGQPAQQQVMIFVNGSVIHGGEISAPVGFDVLLGMDVISTGSLHIEGNGTYSFSF